MAPINRFPIRAVLLFGTLPALVIGGALWFLADLVPECSIVEQSRQTSPDGAFDLVVFARVCGPTTAPNLQAAMVPAEEDVPYDAASFVSVGAAEGLTAGWNSAGTIDVRLPDGAEAFRRDESVAGIPVTYNWGQPG